MDRVIFKRNNNMIVGTIIDTRLEPGDNGKEVVFFVQDSGGQKYRVPKRDVVMQGSTPFRHKRKKHDPSTRYRASEQEEICQVY